MDFQDFFLYKYGSQKNIHSFFTKNDLKCKQAAEMCKQTAEMCKQAAEMCKQAAEKICKQAAVYVNKHLVHRYVCAKK